MIEFLRDPLWQSVGVVLAFVVSFLIYSLQRQQKKLSYAVLTANRLLTVREEIAGKIQVLYDGQPAKDLCLLVIQLHNSGNTPIATSDYERPISLFFGDVARVLSVEIVERNPSSIVADVSLENNRIVFTPTLLNTKDSLTVKVLLSDFLGTVKSDGRIVGVKEITIAQIGDSYSKFLLFLGGLFGIGGSLLLPDPVVSPNHHLLFGNRDIIGLALMGLSILLTLKVIRRPNSREILKRLQNSD